MGMSRSSYAFGFGLALGAGLALLHGCGQEPTEPPALRSLPSYRLTIGAGSSSAGGTISASRGGISCTVVGATSASEVIGACNSAYPAGTIVSLTAAAASGAVLKLDEEWGGTCEPNVEDHRVCQVTIDRDREVAATFVPASTSFTLTVSGGAGGSGTVYSTPSGITCTITDGKATSGDCSAGFARETQVKLTAKIARGQRLKAWAGGGCEGATRGKATIESCTTTLSRNVGVVVSFDPVTAGLVAGAVGQWDAPISWPAVAINSVLLPNGNILTYGRNLHVPTLWNPITGAFADLALPADFFCSGLALLRDGRLLVTGGHSGRDNFGIKVAYFFDYRTNGWTRAADMRNGRWYPTSTTLPNGQILTISGGDTAGALNTLPEVYQPPTNTWRALTTAVKRIPYYPMMFVAPGGRVFYAGPDQATAFLSPSGTGSWATGPSSRCCYRDYGSAVMYDAGKILLVGGGNTPTNTAEQIDLAPAGSVTWTFVGAMAVARRQHNLTLLADGTVLVTGGTNAVGFNSAPTSSAVLTAELWNPANPSLWKPLASMTHQRLYHSEALLLPDARVLSVGSGQPAATGLTDDFTAEIFSPPYLFNSDGTPATRPVISSAPGNVTYGQTFTVTTTSAATIAKVTWIRLSAVTHSFNQSQRMNVLSFTKGTGQITVTAPANENLSPLGYYMLFIVDTNGVPSVARIIQIT